MSLKDALQIVRVDFAQPAHPGHFLQLMGHYADDPMGGGQGLSEAVGQQLICRLPQRPDWVGLLAYWGPEPVGLMNAFEGFSTFAARPLLNIHDMVVQRDWRGQGIAQALLAATESLARQRGCCKLTLEVLSNNREALQAYERFGFAPYQLDPVAGQALFLEKKF